MDTADFHRVTRWSRLANVWEVASTREIRRKSRPTAAGQHVLVHCDVGYTTDRPMDVFFGNDVLLAFRHDGADLTPEHDYPLRLIIPQRYGWKRGKWVRAIELLDRPEPSFGT